MSLIKPAHRRTIVIVSLIALAAYVAIAVWADLSSSGSALSHLKPQWLLLVFGLSLVNYGFRFMNWQFYLKTLGITKVPRFESLLIFIGGFSLGITPGKVGEVVRSLLLKERHEVPVSKTGTLIVVDRLTDVLALVLIASVGVLQLQYGKTLLSVFAAIALGMLLIISHRPTMMRFLNLLKKIPKLAKHEEKIEGLYDSAHTLLRPSKLAVIVPLSILSWTCEALGFWIVFKALGTSIPLSSAFFVYAFSTLIGAAALLPGGLGLTEGTIAGLLLLLNVEKSIAAVATVLIRLATLWFGLALGLVCMTILELRPRSKPATLE